MDNYRKIIDNIDEQIMKLLEERLLLVKDVGLYKRQNNIPVLDQKREQLIFDKIDDRSVFSGNFTVVFKLILSLVIFFTSISEIEKESNSVEIIFVK